MNTMSATNNSKKHLPELDGLRAIAVIAVIIFHLELNFFSGGFLGVDVFFTLSGFLITHLLLKEFHQEQRINFTSFYIRRFRRLAPAVLAVITVCALLVPFIAPDAQKQLANDIPAALLYYSNWWQIVSEQSYFDMMNREPLLKHLWSLAIEEQFYFIWPLLTVLILKLMGRTGLLTVSLLLMFASAGLMAFIAITQNIPIEHSPNRIYLGSDTHTAGLFAGAFLACLWNPWTQKISAMSTTSSFLLGLLSLGSLIFFFIYANESQPWLYRGGFLLVALATMASIVAATSPRSLFGKLLSIQPLHYLGQRSYSLYLWHWPIFMLLRHQDFTLSAEWVDGLKILLTLVAAELSYRYIETPFRQGTLTQSPWQPKRLASVGVLIMSIALYNLYFHAQEHTIITTTPTLLASTPTNNSPSTTVISEVLNRSSKTDAETTNNTHINPSDILAIGDSVMLGAENYLERGMPGILIDAAVGRQGQDALRIIKSLKEAGKLPSTILIHIGTNGYLQESSLNKLMAELDNNIKVIFVTVHAKKRWVDDNNQLIEKLKADYSQHIAVIDWNKLSAEHADYFVADGIHLSSKGIRAYTDAIRLACGVNTEIISKKTLLAQKKSKAKSQKQLNAHLKNMDTPNKKDPSNSPEHPDNNLSTTEEHSPLTEFTPETQNTTAKAILNTAEQSIPNEKKM